MDIYKIAQNIEGHMNQTDGNIGVLILFGGLILLGFIIKFIFTKIKQRNWVTKDVYIIGPEIATEKEHKKEGFGTKSQNPNSVCFRISASVNGKKEGEIYTSELLCSEADDTWLTGSINGMKTILKYNPKNPKKYKLELKDVPYSQYS